VVDRLDLSQIKTSLVAGILSRLDLTGKKCLILDEGQNERMVLSSRNLPKVQYRRAALANGYELLHADVVLFTKAGLEKAHEVFA
jgi:ribosomal protein L4